MRRWRCSCLQHERQDKETILCHSFGVAAQCHSRFRRADNSNIDKAVNGECLVNLVSVRESLERIMSQDELAVLARGEARRLGLRRALKIGGSQVSRFLSDALPKSQVYRAILSAVEKYLEVDELFFSDVDQHA